jgi:hypothetical protein
MTKPEGLPPTGSFFGIHFDWPLDLFGIHDDQTRKTSLATARLLTFTAVNDKILELLRVGQCLSTKTSSTFHDQGPTHGQVIIVQFTIKLRQTFFAVFEIVRPRPDQKDICSRS